MKTPLLEFHANFACQLVDGGFPQNFTLSVSNTMTSLNLQETASIDRVQLLERCLGIESFADKLASAFIASLPNERQVLRTAVDSADWVQVAKYAHRLRGSASNLCANQLSSAAEAIETAARNDVTESIVSLIENVESEIDRLLNDFGNGLSAK